MKKLSTIFASLLLFLALTTSGYASTVIFDDWTLDLTGIEGQTSAVTDIDQILFHGIGWTQTATNDADYQVGDIGATDGLYNSLTYWDTDGNTLTWGSDLEISFVMSFNSIVTGASATESSWTHLAAGTDLSTLSNPDGAALTDIQRDGILYLYVDDTSDGTGANTATGDGYSDGTLVAKFQVLAGDGGSFSIANLDGHDDATWELIWAEAGVLFDAEGNDLALTIGTDNVATIAITDTNFDADRDDNSILDTEIGTNVFTPEEDQSLFSFLATQDGSSSVGLSTIPEPATFLLFGIGLMSIAGISRKKS